MLLADWFARLAIDAGLELDQHGTSGEAFTLGSPTALNVRAEFVEEAPYLRVVASEESRAELIDRLASQAAAPCGSVGLRWRGLVLDRTP
jgi:hypothetical protein